MLFPILFFTNGWTTVLLLISQCMLRLRYIKNSSKDRQFDHEIANMREIISQNLFWRMYEKE